MDRQLALAMQAATIGLHINRQRGRCCSVTLGGNSHELSVLVLSEHRIEPLYSRTIHLARPDDSEFAVARAVRDAAEVVVHMQRIAGTGQPRTPT